MGADGGHGRSCGERCRRGCLGRGSDRPAVYRPQQHLVGRRLAGRAAEGVSPGRGRRSPLPVGRARPAGPGRPAARRGWPRRARPCAPWPRRPTRRTASRAPGSRARRRSTSRPESDRLSCDRTSEGISRSGPLVTMTDRIRCGNPRRSGSCRASQKVAQLPQPDERKASSVSWSLLVTATARASPVGVTPATAGTGSAGGPMPGGRGDGTGRRVAGAARTGHRRPTPSSCRERRMSAWLRRRPATSMPRTRTTNVDDNDQCDHAASFGVLLPVSTGTPGDIRGTVAAASTGPVGHTPVLCRHDDLFLPEPEPREVHYTVISVDDHVVEPAHTFEGRLPAALADRAPRIVETPEGHQVWEFEGRALHPGRDERGGRPPPGDLRPRAVPLRPDAAGLLRHRRPGRATWTSTGSGRR